VILSISHGDGGDNCCLEKGSYLGMESAGAGERGRIGGWGVWTRGLRHGVSRVLSP
jgi:hypothetical protein